MALVKHCSVKIGQRGLGRVNPAQRLFPAKKGLVAVWRDRVKMGVDQSENDFCATKPYTNACVTLGLNNGNIKVHSGHPAVGGKVTAYIYGSFHCSRLTVKLLR